MAITISGENNNDRILAADGVIDQISGINIVGLITASHINVGSNINLGNAGIVTATTFVGNLTGNVNSTSPLLLQTGGSERFRITGNNELGIAGANYGSSGQVLASGGSGSAVTWAPLAVTGFTNGSNNRVVTATSGSGLNGEANLTFDGTTLTNTGGRVLIGTTTAGESSADELTVANSGHAGMTIRSGTSSWGSFFFSDGTSGGAQYDGAIEYKHNDNYMRFRTAQTERLRIDSGGSVFAGGTVLSVSDLNWTKDTYQRPHIFSGITGGNPSDGAVTIASPETNPSNTRIGALVFGCKTSSTTGVSNSGLKAVIELSLIHI